MAEDNKTVEIILKVNAAQFKRGVIDATNAFSSSTRQIQSTSVAAGRGIDGLTSKVLGLAAAYVSVSQSINLVKSLLSTAGNFESLRATLTTLTGSAEAGEEAFAWIKDFTKETPFALDGVTQGFIQLKAFGLDPINGTYQAIADQAAALGSSQETLNGIILAVGQAWAKQKLQGEEVLQLVERGVNVWALLAQATGKNVQELQKLSEQGKLGRETISLLIKEMGKGVDGAAIRAMDTWNGLVSNALVEWQEFLDLIGESGTMDFFKQELKDLLAEIQRLKENDQLAEYAQDIADAIVGTAKAIKSFTELVVGLKDEIKILVELLVARKLLSFGSGLYKVAESVLAASTAFQFLNRNIRIFKALATFGLAIAIDLLITKMIDLGEEANKTAAEQKQLEKDLRASQQAIRDEMAKPVESKVKDVLDATLEAQKAFNSEFAKAKADETNAIRNELANQLKLYEDHLKGLADAQKKQKDIAKEFADFVKDINSGGGENETPDIIDFYGDLEQAKTKLREGDFDGAIEGARNLAEMVKTMRDNGEEADIVLRELARQTEKLANDAASQKVDDETKKLEQAELVIKELVRDAAFLKELEIGFDQALAAKNADDLRELLRRRLSENPLVIPVELGKPVDLKAANDLLDRSAANDPLIPDVPQITPDTSPIVRPLRYDTSEAEQQLQDFNNRFEQAASQPIKRPLQLDTTQADKDLQAIEEKAEKPVTKPVYIQDGNRFSDRQNAFDDAFRLESLKTGHRQ